ncbi:carbohydrate-binding protein [Acinetobacter johnsonii]|uniref:carbohydrate-binding protein n=1 Tax=Acinetobacter johnsonii TaxID=40214 RepID=UPI001CCEF98F|nr:carbohydrate-binding protein [Acinetobacter johnsonii]UBQ39380.1 carbohydrate-binding protein [Acinetobacter johnsonii]
MKQVITKNNFSAGELSPTLYTRTDIQQYGNGAKTLKNVIPLVEGGVRKRPGTLFLSEQVGAVRLIPFVVNSSKTYVLVFKPNLVQVVDTNTMTSVAELVSPYAADQINDIQYVQYRYEMYLTHEGVNVHRLMCDSSFANWTLSEFIFTHAPTDSENARFPFRKGKPSGKDIGAIVSFTLDAFNAWVSTQSYLTGDVITYGGQYYVALRDNQDKQPTTSEQDWAVATGSAINGFTASDIGSFIEVNGGIIKITQYINANQVNGEILKKLDADILAIERSWGILPPAFNATNGYPRCCTYYKQRLVLSNTKKAPNKIWFSAVGGNGNFLETTEDGDALSIVSASGLSNSILFLEAQRGVVCLTSGGEYMVDSEGALTPTTVNINEHSAYGAYPVTRPERVGNELLFVQRGGERVRALTYRFEVDGLVSPEVSSLSSHIGEIHGGVNEISYMQEPESLVWLVLGDGKVASITFNRDQEVLAWAQHDFSGDVVSMCSTPTLLGSDRTFMLVNRSGTTCLEEVSFSALVDSQRTLAVANGSVDKPNLLNEVVAYHQGDDFIYQANLEEDGGRLVVGGELNGESIKVGQPIQCIVELFPPELSQAPMSTMLHKAKVDRTAFFFNNTIAPELNGEMIEIFTYDDNPLAPRKPHTGYHLEEGGSWEDLHRIPLVITHNKPLPFHLQAITMQLSINEK